ncbi:hypothetical protein MYA_4126 [Burkholderia sp. KJ006]|nr:hypothetical protein MYA_4126 [Burkholderia sp. KJ006]
MPSAPAAHERVSSTRIADLEYEACAGASARRVPSHDPPIARP